MGPLKRRAVALIPPLAVSVALTGCSAQPRAATRTTLAPGVPTTTIAPAQVPGTAETGTLSYLGSVDRVAVFPVPDKEAGAPASAPQTESPVEVAYRRVGSGKPLLLIPGEDASMDWWSPPLVHLLSQHYEVVMFDLPGVGYSGPAPAGESIDWLADVTAGLSNELGLSSPTVLGWGMGAQVAAAVAARHPGVVGDLVLTDSAMPTPTSSPPLSRATNLLASTTATPAALSGVMFPSGSGPARHSWLRELTEQVPDVVSSTAVKQQAAMERALWHNGSATSQLASVKVPTLVIGGTLDRIFPSSDTASLASAIAGSQRYLWPGTGYANLIQSPSQFTTLLEDFTG